MRTINICNLKGGVGKTITAVNLSYVLSEIHKKKVLLVDNDKQGNSSKFFDVHGYDHPSIADIMTGAKSVEEVIRKTTYERIDIIPANMALLAANKAVLLDTMKPQQTRIKNALAEIADRYDIAIIDNAPDENMSVINALTAGDDVIIPVKVDKFTFDGVDEMLQCVKQVKENFNPKLTFRGCVITSFKNNEVNQQGAAYLSSLSKYRLMRTQIHWSAKVDESTFAALPIMKHSPRSWAARDYKKLAAEYLAMIDGVLESGASCAQAHTSASVRVGVSESDNEGSA